MQSLSPQKSQIIEQSGSMSLTSSLAYPFRLNNKDQKRLGQIYQLLSKNILGLRSKKIVLLEKYNLAITSRIAWQSKIKNLEILQQKKMVEERIQQQKNLHQLLSKRLDIRQKLKQTVENYRKTHNILSKQIDLTHAQRYLQLDKERKIVENDIEMLQTMQKQGEYQIGLRSIQDLVTQVEALTIRKGSIIVQNKKNNLQRLKYKLKQLNCYELKSFTESKNLGQKGKQIISLLEMCKWQQHQTIQILNYVEQERSHKQLLFLDILQMKSDMQIMQSQNRSIQAILYDQFKQ